jgi:hypothetical protein
MKSLPSTFITKEESNKREQWFNDHKYPILDVLTILQEGEHENKKLDFIDIKTAIAFFNLLIQDSPDGDIINGVRVYFASPSSDGTVSNGKCGKLTLVFVSTTGNDSSDFSIYYAFKDGAFVPIPEDQAKKWVHNYQNIKRKELFKTLSDQDTLDGCKETKHIFFSFSQMQETIEEMEYQNLEHGSIVKSFGIRFTSYTNQNYQVGHSTPVKHKRRLSIGFTFIDDKNNDIGIENIDPVEFEERMRMSFRDDTMDSGDPTPPPPTNNGENLDVSSD